MPSVGFVMVKAMSIVYFYESAFMMWRRRLAGIFAVARQEGWHVEPVNADLLESGVEPVLAYWKPDGIIVEGGALRHPGCGVACFAGQKAVFCDVDERRFPGRRYFGVRHNQDGVVKRALGELFSRGFADYGYVHFHTRREWSMERERIFASEIGERGLNSHVFKSWKRGKDEDIVAFDRRLEDFVGGIPKPCGILAANDEMAVRVLRAAERIGIRVPEEMAVMGIDDDELICENVLPTLSSVAPDFERSGRLAAGLLARRLARPKLEPVVLEFGSGPLVRRYSTRKTERVDIRAVRAVEYVRENACKGIAVADVVRSMGLKTRTAENRFREVSNRSIRDEIISVRIEAAKKLLRESKIAVNAIYSRCGYRDERSLRHVFTKVVGMSPLAYRKSGRR